MCETIQDVRVVWTVSARHSEGPPFRKVCHSESRHSGFVGNSSRYCVLLFSIGRFKGGKGAIPCQKSPFTFPMLHKQLVMIAHLTVCLSLSHHIRVYLLDFWCIFTVLFIEYNLKFTAKIPQNAPFYNQNVKKTFWGGDTPSLRPSTPAAPQLACAFGAPLAPLALHTHAFGARLTPQMQFLDPPMYLAIIGLLHRSPPSLCGSLFMLTTTS